VVLHLGYNDLDKTQCDIKDKVNPTFWFWQSNITHLPCCKHIISPYWGISCISIFSTMYGIQLGKPILTRKIIFFQIPLYNICFHLFFFIISYFLLSFIVCLGLMILVHIKNAVYKQQIFYTKKPTYIQLKHMFKLILLPP
jgi:hypothetical protein